MTPLEWIKLLRGRESILEGSQRAIYIEHNCPVLEEQSVASISELIFLNGDCWRFALLFMDRFPGAIAHQCHYSTGENTGWNHVLVEYHQRFYDITGEISNIDEWQFDCKNVPVDELERYRGVSLMKMKEQIIELTVTPSRVVNYAQDGVTILSVFHPKS